MSEIYSVAGHRFAFRGVLADEIVNIPAFSVFLTDAEEADVFFEDSPESEVPEMAECQYCFEYEDVKGEFGRCEKGYMMSLCPESRPALYLWSSLADNVVHLCGNYEVYLLRFALWIGFGLKTCHSNTLAVHSSCIVKDGKAVLFLGESGTGKSTHTRLWRENIEGAFLLNDDSPVLREEEGRIMVYGSPWSGKTPCYKAEAYELAACVRLSQAPANSISRLAVLQAYGALHPSCPPQFAYDEYLYDGISATLSAILQAVPCYSMACLPDADAARMSCKTIFG